jgi:hypothetical protein
MIASGAGTVMTGAGYPDIVAVARRPTLLLFFSCPASEKDSRQTGFAR